ncbi:MAG: ABC transporter permease, partial [Oscillospiraceae bacterium]|nr:ABC transporter permease [Oscillospiraceae bacterium]
MNGKTHTPLIQVSKRETLPWQKSWLIRGIAIVAALVVCALITTMLTGENPIQVYGSMVSGAFGTGRRIWQLLRNVAILLTISLAVTPAFKMRFWNVGAEGQVMAGALACTVTMLYLGDKLPNALLILVMLIASVAAGALWAFIPAFFKAKWNTNETL